MLLKLYQAGQPVLRQPAKHLTKQQLLTARTQEVIDYMIATLRDAPGVGLAAPQVGEALQIIVLEDKAKYHELVPADLLAEQGRKPIKLRILINPTLELIEPDTALYFEGCLSVDGYTAAVARAWAVKVTALDRTGKPISFVAHGWQARILQHEVDHLFGTLYIDCMQTRSFMTLKTFSLHWRTAQQTEIQAAFGSTK